MKSNWYVYRHIREDKNVPFYIGMGNKKHFVRAFETHPSKRSELWCRVASKTTWRVEIMCMGLTRDEAVMREKEFIALYKRLHIGGTLVNLTDGGDGGNGLIHTPETKRRFSEQKMGSRNPMFGIKQTAEQIEKRASKSRGLLRSKETKNKQSFASITSGQAKRCRVFHFETDEFMGEFHSLSEACRQLGLSKSSTRHAFGVANGKRNHTSNLVFRYIT